MDLGSIIKEAIIEYIKSHDKNSGKVVELFNHIDETVKCAQSLPVPIQKELLQVISFALAANGLEIQFKK